MEAKAKGQKKPQDMTGPMIQLASLKEVFSLFCDRKTQKIPLNEVPYVLRAMGLTIYGDEEKKIKEEVEKVDGLGKPVSFSTLNDWCEKNKEQYDRSYEDTCDAVTTLCHQGLIGDRSDHVNINQLRHVMSEVGDKIPASSFDKILAGGQLNKGGNTDKAALKAAGHALDGETVTVNELIDFLRK
eukprot:gnl/TRDRNA2_/TRDRNA2_182219_c0_seq1.p2 gnl/TRDRNA2_/TRDRNA2_182219_c0~~gnl/TRDRNA2_/TRDRNA2_182219_c0_seq1.p2  ORF type:complete len:217 (-),score=59.03 gnl/TRDRNA2_/TRDRNA2_182219_c0_seq1:230-784(-)